MSKADAPAPIQIEDFARGTRSNLTLPLFQDGMGSPLGVPFIVVRGGHDGPVLGLCAAVHGDELNGIRIIHRVVESLDLATLRGSLVCCPIVNVPAYEAGRRRFLDGTDLNHSFPGKWKGRTAEQYAKRFGHVFLHSLNALVDIHTASAGRINSFYVRADMQDERVRRLATLAGSDIILHAKGGDGTLRNAARVRGIDAITVEAGNPRIIQRGVVDSAIDGISNIMRDMGMIDGEIVDDDPAIVCRSSSWLYTRTGGLLETRFQLLDTLEKNQVIAVTRDPFGNVNAEYKAPGDGIVIGMARNPVAVPGTRFIHLGSIGDPSLNATIP